MAQYNIQFSSNASTISKQLSRLQADIARLGITRTDIKLKLDTADFTRAIDSSFKELDKAISKAERRLRKLPIGSSEFAMEAGQAGQLRGERERGRMMASAIGSREAAQAFDTGSLARYERALESLQIQASLIAPNTREWVNLQRNIGAIRGEMQKASKTAESIQLRETLGAFSPGSLNQLQARLTILKNRAHDIAPNTAAWKQLNKEIQRTESSIQKLSKSPLTMGQRAGAAGGAFLYGGGMGGGLGSALGGVVGGLAKGVPGAFAGAALGQLADNMGQTLGATASYTAEIDKQRIALRNVTKDVNEYKSALGFIDRTSRDLAIPQDILNKQFTQISASVIGAGGNVDAAKEAFLGIAAGIRGTGGSLADMQGALLATSQVFSKGKVSAEELRQQIGERLPGAFTLFAQSMGKTPQELDKMLEQGQVTLNDFMGFVRLLSSEYGASASEIAASSQAAGDRLATTMSRMREAVGRELQPLGAQFQGIFEQAIIDNEKNLVALARGFSEAAQAIGSFIEKYGGLIGSLGSAAFLFGGTILAAKGLAAAFIAIGAAIPAATAAIAGYGGVVGTLKLAIAGLGGPITLTIASLLLLGKIVYDTNETFRNVVNNIGGVVASDFKRAVDDMADAARVSANRIREAYEEQVAKLQGIAQFISNIFKQAFQDISNSAEKSATASSNAFGNFFKNLSTQATAGFNGLNSVINSWWSKLPAPIRRLFEGQVAGILTGGASYLGGAVRRAANTPSTGMFGRFDAWKAEALAEGQASSFSFPGGDIDGAGTGAGAGAKPPADRTLELTEQLNLLIKMGEQEAKIRDLQFEGRDLLVVLAEQDKALCKLILIAFGSCAVQTTSLSVQSLTQ
jgi:tape measure domain-containing protein